MTGTITVAQVAAGGGNNVIQIVFKNCAPFTNCISEINNTQVGNAKYIDILIPIYNLTEYSSNYSKTPESLWQLCRDKPALNNDDNPVDLPGNSASFKCKQKITGSPGYDTKKAFQIMVPLKYFSNFWRTLKMSLINCEISLIVTWSQMLLRVKQQHLL